MSHTKTIEVLKDFKFAHRGCDVREYVKGDIVTLEDEAADIALGEKWAKPIKTKAEKADKAIPAAPENKDAASAAESAPETASGDTDPAPLEE